MNSQPQDPNVLGPHKPQQPHEPLFQIRPAAFASTYLGLDAADVTAANPGGGKALISYTASAKESFYQHRNANGTVSFESWAYPGVFLRMYGLVGGNVPIENGVVGGSRNRGGFEEFRLLPVEDGMTLLGSGPNTSIPVNLRADAAGMEITGSPGGFVTCRPQSLGVDDLEKFVVLPSITHHECMKACDQFIEWFPEEAASIDRYREDIACTCCPPFKTRTPLGELMTVEYADSRLNLQRSVETNEPLLSPCTYAIGAVVFDVASLALSLVGLGKMFRTMTRRLYESIDPYIKGFMQSINKINEATNSGQLAKAIFSFLGEIWNAGMFRLVWDYLKEQMRWWDWIVTGAIAVAQMLAWFGTEGVAFVAEVVLILPSFASLVNNSISAVSICSA